MQQKPITISVNEFNEKFRNNLRDYYIYQFKRFQKDNSSDYRKKGTNEIKPANTFTEEKQRLISLLERQTQIEWTKEKGGICYCTADTRFLDTNPFWEPYRFCSFPHNYLGWFLCMVLLLHPRVRLRDPSGRIDQIIPRVLSATLNARPESKDNIVSLVITKASHLYSNSGQKITEAWGEFCYHRYCAIHRQKINGRKMVFEKDPDRFGVKAEVLLKFHSQRGGHDDVQNDQFKNRLHDTHTGILRSERVNPRDEQWRLSSNTLQPLWDHPELRFRFQQLVGYCSQALPLGFIGQRLQYRLGEPRNLIRHPRNYTINTLNDFNIADLLHAISHGLWLRLEHRNPIRLEYQQMVCYPLQIRESVRDGRQYLMFYHPELRSIGSIRLDSIDRIHYGTVEAHPDYAEDIAHAKKTLDYIWGVSVYGYYQGNILHRLPNAHIKLILRRDTPELESRLQQEARHGKVTVDHIRNTLTYEAEVADPLETIPWIRSYSIHILEFHLDGVEYVPQTAAPAEELREKIVEWINAHTALPDRREIGNPIAFQPQNHPDYPHEYLFNPIYSVAFDTVVQTVSDMMQHPNQRYTLHDLTVRIRKAWPEKLPLHEKMLETIQENITLLCSGSISDGFRLDYFAAEDALGERRSLWNLIPLSDLEASYLKGILLHPKAELFLSPQEIRQILSGLQEQTEPINFRALFYYDQDRKAVPFHASELMRQNVSALLTSADQCSGLDAVYNGQTERFTVAHLEYAKPEDRFQACCVDAAGHVFFREPAEFLSLQPTEELQDRDTLHALVRKQADDNTKKLVLTFLNDNNRADRLATEFSPWKKTCIYRHTEQGRLFTMELFYDARDTSEIAVRLLRYGKDLRIDRDSGDVALYISRLRTAL